MRYLAFDYGTKHSGLAVGGDITQAAQPLRPLTMNKGRADERELQKIITQWQPDAFVIGMPAAPTASSDNAANIAAAMINGPASQPINIAKRAYSFSQYLQRKFARPCHFVDERLSSRVMEHKMKAAGIKPQDGLLDSMVACALLKEWLEQHDRLEQHDKLEQHQEIND